MGLLNKDELQNSFLTKPLCKNFISKILCKLKSPLGKFFSGFAMFVLNFAKHALQLVDTLDLLV
jgi:hypothetical protein